jgi:Uma2 family endonuclease
MSIAARLVSADELFQMPEDGPRCELVEGEIQEMTPAGFEHGIIIGEIHGRVWSHVARQGLGVVTGAETGFLIQRNPDTVLAPDVAFVEQHRAVSLGYPKTFSLKHHPW